MAKTSPPKFALFSFFSGIGLLDLGFEDEGFEIVFANDVKPSFMKAYEFSREVLARKPSRVGHCVCSIDEFASRRNLAFLLEEQEKLRQDGYRVGFIGGPPCPDFSVGGKNRGKDGENGRLSKSYVELICKVKPDFFVFENVKGLFRTKKHRDFYESLKLSLRKHGYHLSDALLNAIEFGVPQDRDRVFLFGVRCEVEDKDTAAAIGQIDLRRYAMFPGRSAFEDYAWKGKQSDGRKRPPVELTVSHWFKKNRTDLHPNAVHVFKPRAALTKFQTIAEGDDSKKSFKRLHRDRYSPTAAYGNNEVHIHPTEPRRLTAAEVMAIQSLPPTYQLPPDMSLTDMFKTLGNAVPYLLARGVAKSISECLSPKGSKRIVQR